MHPVTKHTKDVWKKIYVKKKNELEEKRDGDAYQRGRGGGEEGYRKSEIDRWGRIVLNIAKRKD